MMSSPGAGERRRQRYPRSESRQRSLPGLRVPESSRAAPCVHGELTRMLELEVWGGENEVRSDALVRARGNMSAWFFPVVSKETLKQTVKSSPATEGSLLLIDVWPRSSNLSEDLLSQRGRLLQLGCPPLLFPSIVSSLAAGLHPAQMR